MTMNSETLIREFQTPSGDYVPLLMWFWNDVITEDQITFQMEKMREQNITNFFIHPACGFAVEYLSDRYMELIQYVVREAKRLGMYYWIYDEYEFPSGTAGGLLCERYPEHRQQILMVEDRTLETPADRVNICRWGRFVGAQLVWRKNGKNYVRDITDECEVTTCGEATTLTYRYRDTMLNGRALFFFSEVSRSVRTSGAFRVGGDSIPGYVNLLSREAVGKFIQLTHERYKAAIGDEFGKTVRGVFTDEPTPLGMLSRAGGPWSDNLFEEFEADHGYSLKPLLYCLWDTEASSPREIQVLQDYRDTVRRLYFDSFMKQIGDWCHDNSLIFTGHFGGEENLIHHLAQGDMLQELMLFDMPGADSILSFDRIETPEFNIAGKLASTAAKFIGAPRVLCETFSGSGWRLRFPMMKRIANRLLVMGINWIQYMGGFYSVGANAKNFPFGFAPSHNYQNTLFAHYHDLNKYIAGFQALSANTRPESSVLLFIPLAQALQERWRWIRGKWNEFDSFADVLNCSFIDTVNALLYEGIGFDFFSENMADRIIVQDGYAEAFGYRYDTLIFPRMYHVNGKTRALIEQLRAHGVKVIFTYDLPGVDTDSGLAFDPGFHMEVYNTAAGLQRDGNVWFITRDFPGDPDLYRAALRCVIPDRTLHIEADNGVYIAKRSNEDTEVYFLSNDGSDAARVCIDALPGMRILDPDTGAEAAYTVRDGRISLTLAGLEMLAIIRDKASSVMPESTISPLPAPRELVLDGPYAFSADGGNYLPLNYEMYDSDLQEWVKCEFMHFAPEIHMLPGDPYRLRARVQIDHMPEKLLLNAEVMRVNRLAVNGTDLAFCVNTRRWSPNDYTVDVTALMHEGENIIELDGISESIVRFTRPQYLFLSGDFTVAEGDRIAAAVETIPAIGWEKAGYPYYCGDGTYRAKGCLDSVCESARLIIPTDDIAAVFINGKPAGKKLWPNHEIEVSSLLVPGENEIAVCITSCRTNMFGCAAEGVGESIFYGSYAHAVTENGLLAPLRLALR